VRLDAAFGQLRGLSDLLRELDINFRPDYRSGCQQQDVQNLGFESAFAGF
jgi:hypothetical protein